MFKSLKLKIFNLINFHVWTDRKPDTWRIAQHEKLGEIYIDQSKEVFLVIGYLHVANGYKLICYYPRLNVVRAQIPLNNPDICKVGKEGSSKLYRSIYTSFLTTVPEVFRETSFDVISRALIARQFKTVEPISDGYLVYRYKRASRPGRLIFKYNAKARNDYFNRSFSLNTVKKDLKEKI